MYHNHEETKLISESRWPPSDGLILTEKQSSSRDETGMDA
jgi:hypothetical protein